MNLREPISEFLAQRTLAVIGASRNEKDFSRVLVREFQNRGFHVIPVNRHGQSEAEIPWYLNVGDIPTPPDAALLMVARESVPAAIRECVLAGVKHIWIFGVGSPRKLDEETRNFLRDHGVSVVNGFCPLMFLPGSAWPHRLHGWIAEKIQGSKLKVQVR